MNLILLTLGIVYLSWRIYSNYKSNIKYSFEIILLISNIIIAIGNIYFNDNIYITFISLSFIAIVSYHVTRKSYSKS